MKRIKRQQIGRREFAKTLGTAAIAAAFAPSAESRSVPPPQSGTPALATPAVPGITAAQQERVREIVARDAAGRAATRKARLPYDLEPAFIFGVRRPERSGRKP